MVAELGASGAMGQVYGERGWLSRRQERLTPGRARKMSLRLASGEAGRARRA